MASRRKFGFCTLCLGKERNLQDAFEHSEIGFKPQMVIEDLLHVQVCNGGHIPWMICGRCMQKLNAFRNFKCDAMKSLKVLKILLLDNDSEGDLQIPTNSEFNDVGEQNLSTGNGRYVLKQEEDEVTEFHRSDSEIAVKVEEVTITESEETSFPSNIEDFSEDTPEYLQNYASVSEFGDGCSEGDTCIGVSCDDDEDDELCLYLESDRESEVGGQGEEDESSPCQVSSPQSGSSVSGGNSNMEAAEIREEEESHKRVEDESLDVPRRTRRSARLQTGKGCDGGNSKEKQGSTNGEVKNDLMMQAGADGKNTRRKKTKGMETKSVSPRSSVVEQRMGTNMEQKREWRRKYLQSMSEEKRRELSRKQWEAAKRRLANMTEEQKKEFIRRNTELCRRQRAQMSEEERREYNRKQREGAKRRLANMTEEQKKECTRRNNVNAKRYRAQMSDEERKACNRRHAEIRKKRIARMSEEEREEYRRKINERKRKYRSQ